VGRVEGKGIIITGAGRGMGRAFAFGLAREGATVGVLDFDSAAAQRVCDELKDEGLLGLPLAADVSKRDQIVAAFDSFVERTGRIDVLFNNAGINVPMHLLDVTEDNWNSIMNVNALGVLIGIQEGARRMIPAGAGKIVNTSSIAGVRATRVLCRTAPANSPSTRSRRLPRGASRSTTSPAMRSLPALSTPHCGPSSMRT
jgi:meso-butanediol dehydrogenase/(S,S)-butanediol dehydrogenase/diacetyl reductase